MDENDVLKDIIYVITARPKYLILNSGVSYGVYLKLSRGYPTLYYIYMLLKVHIKSCRIIPTSDNVFELLLVHNYTYN